MPYFLYKYKDNDGQIHQGEAESHDRDTLLSELREKGAVLEIKEIDKRSDAGGVAPSAKKPNALIGRVSREELTLFTRQMATMLVAGLPLMKVMAILRKRCKNRALASVLDDLSDTVQEGGRFSDCLDRHPLVFDQLYVNLIRVGEASGKLPGMVEELATLLDKDAALQRRIQSAMAYPSFILVFMAFLSWVIVAFLMPLFMPMFTSSGLNIKSDYPLTYWLIQLTTFVNDRVHFVLLVLLGVGGYFAARRAWNDPKTRQLVDRIVLSIPVFNFLFQSAAVARFTRTLATLMNSGMPLLQALNLVSGAVGNAIFGAATDRVANQITKGKRMSDAIELESAVFPDLVIQMVQVGEGSGALPAMLGRAADYYDSQLDAAVQRLIAMLEPAMMIVVGGIVCTFVMAVLLPILGLAQMK